MSPLADVLAEHPPTVTEHCRCGAPCDTLPLWAKHVTEAVAAAGLAVIQLPEQVPIPKGWHDNCLGAWSACATDDPVSAWPDGVADSGGRFMPVAEARNIAAALLAAANAAEQVTA